VCGQIRLAEAGRCVDCSVQDWSFPQLDGLYGYQEPGGELLRLYKFGGLASLARAWGPGVAARLQPPAPLVPVPPLRRNLWRRGWDPVATFARAAAASAGLPVWNALARQSSASQKTLRREGRWENARLAYRLRRGWSRRLAAVPSVWLLDDVVTTGATVEACSRLLRDAGVREVRVFCLGLH
jgi:ComF family protein